MGCQDISLSFSSMYFKISFDLQIIYECICNLKMFRDFPVILLLLISSLSPLLS